MSILSALTFLFFFFLALAVLALDEYDETDNCESDNRCDLDDVEVSAPETVTLMERRTLSFSYTKHHGIARYTDDTERPFTFDGMKHKDNAIVLWNYEFPGGDFRGEIMRKTRPFVTIPYANLKDFETVKRVDKERTETYSVHYANLPRPEAEFLAEGESNYFIREDQNG